MDKIIIPNLGEFRSDDLYWFFLRLSSINACWHSDLTSDEQDKLKVEMMCVVRDFFTRIEYTQPQSSIRPEHRNFGSDNLERFYRNMWSHREKM